MGLITRIADKAGALGSVVSAMGCAACFPAIASLGAAIGLGFLQEYEGLFISKLLPLFAVVALLANALGWLSHRQWYRSLLGWSAQPSCWRPCSCFLAIGGRRTSSMSVWP
jgi:mercuric ion transport protein